MGNRAVIRFQGDTGSTDVYLHWNGGRASVEGFLAAGRELRALPAGDSSYAAARFIQIVGNFFGGTLSVGVGYCIGDPGDNGIYLVRGGRIVGRQSDQRLPPEEVDPEKTAGILFECLRINRPIFERDPSWVGSNKPNTRAMAKAAPSAGERRLMDPTYCEFPLWGGGPCGAWVDRSGPRHFCNRGHSWDAETLR